MTILWELGELFGCLFIYENHRDNCVLFPFREIERDGNEITSDENIVKLLIKQKSSAR